MSEVYGIRQCGCGGPVLRGQSGNVISCMKVTFGEIMMEKEFQWTKYDDVSSHLSRPDTAVCDICKSPLIRDPELYTSYKKSSCGHFFHAHCIVAYSWISTGKRKDPKCPTCDAVWKSIETREEEGRSTYKLKKETSSDQ